MPSYIYNSYTEEHVPKGKTGYYKMTVNYSAKGESKSKVIMSFSNPGVYDTIKKLKGGETIDVEFVKDDKYFNWATVKIADIGAGGPAAGTPGLDNKPVQVRSNYETPEERARKQVYIIKQSSLANAIEYTKDRPEGTTMDELLATAQQFTDWVMEDQKEDVFAQPNDL